LETWIVKNTALSYLGLKLKFFWDEEKKETYTEYLPD